MTTAVGPSPFATETIGTVRLDQPLVLEERGTRRCPSCLPGPSRSIVQRIGESLMCVAGLVGGG